MEKEIQLLYPTAQGEAMPGLLPHPTLKYSFCDEVVEENIVLMETT